VLVPPKDIAGYADALERYVTEPDLRRAHGAAGEERSRAYAWDAINQAVADTYVRLIAARQAGSA
jgi:glycosyltransferase involved in cell wall biosynthesis